MNKLFALDASTLLRKKKSLRREWLAQPGLLEKRIAILGGSTTDEVADMLELCLLARGIKPVFYQSGFQQYLSESLQPEKALQAFRPELVYVHTSFVNIQAFPQLSDDAAAVDALLAQQVAHFTAVWDGIRTHLDCPVIQNNVEEPWHRPLGNLDGSDHRGRSRFVARLNEAFAHAAQARNDLIIHDIHYLSARIGIDHWFNPRQWYLYKYAMDMEAIVPLAMQLAAVIAGLFGLSRKCLVLDLDNTLWGGVIGDDGVDGIVLGNDSAAAEAHSELQRYALQLKERGVLLAVCSKNDEANARAGFAHPDSILQLDDFSAFRANWDDKPDNIAAIASELGIGVDSLVFLDDNPAERELVRQQLASVAVPEIDEIAGFVRALDQAALFESASLSAEDIHRARQYQDNRERQQQAAHFASYDDFLRSLDMHAVIEPFRERQLERITQLTNKTNQFNLTTRRCSSSEEIRDMATQEDYITLAASLGDRFGDNGLVSVIAGRIDSNMLHIELWLMSCRVLKRGLEYALLEQLCWRARQRGITALVGYYLPTARNTMVSELYSQLGFQLLEQADGQSTWQLNITGPLALPAHCIAIRSGADT